MTLRGTSSTLAAMATTTYDARSGGGASQQVDGGCHLVEGRPALHQSFGEQREPRQRQEPPPPILVERLTGPADVGLQVGLLRLLHPVRRHPVLARQGGV